MEASTQNINNSAGELKLPDMHELLDRLMSELQSYSKKGSLLFIEESDEETPATETKIGGINFYLPTNKKWPTNEETGDLLTPVIQINFEDFKDFGQKEKKGIFQLFIDFDYKFKDIVLTKNSFGIEMRYIQDVSESKARKIEVDPEEVRAASPGRINKKEYLSLPSAKSKYDLPENHLFMKWNWDKATKNGERIWSIYNYTEGLYIEDELISRFGGYAPWIDKDQTPICSVCGNRMDFLTAVGTEDTDFDFDEEGYIMIFTCNYMSKCGGASNPCVIIQTY